MSDHDNDSDTSYVTDEDIQVESDERDESDESDESGESDVSVEDCLSELKRIRELFDWEIEEHRVEIFRRFCRLIGDWKGPLPNLRDIFRPREIDWLITKEGTNIKKRLLRTPPLIKFVIETGYKDEPEVDESGKPLLHRATPVHRAARSDFYYNCFYIELFQVYDRFDVNYVNEYGLTHLHVVCQYDCEDIVSKFIELGHDLNCIEQKEGNSPLHFALKYVQEKVVKLLLRNGTNPNIINAEGSTALHIVAELQWQDFGKMFFEICDENRQTVHIDVLDKNGRTPLHSAVDSGLEKMAELLLRRGANPNLADKDGLTPLHMLCQQGRHDEDTDADIVRMIFELSNDKYQPIQVDAVDNFGRRPLHMAIREGFESVAVMLLKHGADPNITNNYGETALHPFCKRYNENMVELLLEPMHHEVQVDVQDEWGNTPLHVAVIYQRPKAVELLLQNGADPNLFNKDGLTPLQMLCKKPCHGYRNVRDGKDYSNKMMELLLKRGGNPNLANEQGLTALHFICQTDEDNSSMELFLKINRDIQQTVEVDARDNSGRTPLELAVTNHLPHAVEVLLNNGADLKSFVFPTKAFVAKYHRRNYMYYRKAVESLKVIDHLENWAYKLDPSDSLKIMQLFAMHGLFKMSTGLECWYDDKEFVKRAKEIKIRPSLSLYDLIQLRSEEAEKVLTYSDCFKLASSKKSVLLSWDSRQKYDEYLYKIMLTKFFRRWAMGFFMSLTRYRLPILCCDIILGQLVSEDLYNICVAATVKKLRMK